jgi:DNA transposition AAA+ family ATPase
MTETPFVETWEYERFEEFCDACREYKHIGLCYGPPGVGKTVSARYYTNWKKVASRRHNDPSEGSVERGLGDNMVVLYTPPVANSPSKICRELGSCRDNFSASLLNYLQKQERSKLVEMDRRFEERYPASACNGEMLTYQGTEEYRRELVAGMAAWNDYRARRRAIRELTVLIIIDEADRLKTAALEQVRAIFDQGGIGLVLIGMRGIEKRLSRYPQLYSRVGFVHQFSVLREEEIRRLLKERCAPPGVKFPEEGITDEEAITAIIRITGGNFRLLERLLTQIGRILKLNELQKVTPDVVAAARESLVIGTV